MSDSNCVRTSSWQALKSEVLAIFSTPESARLAEMNGPTRHPPLTSCVTQKGPLPLRRARLRGLAQSSPAARTGSSKAARIRRSRRGSAGAQHPAPRVRGALKRASTTTTISIANPATTKYTLLPHLSDCPLRGYLPDRHVSVARFPRGRDRIVDARAETTQSRSIPAAGGQAAQHDPLTPAAGGRVTGLLDAV